MKSEAAREEDAGEDVLELLAETWYLKARAEAHAIASRAGKPGSVRNVPCPCGSGKKYKRCCLAGERKAESRKRKS